MPISRNPRDSLAETVLVCIRFKPTLSGEKGEQIPEIITQKFLPKQPGREEKGPFS